MTTTSEILSAKILMQKNCQRIIPDTSRTEALLFPRAELSFISSLARDVSEDEAAIYLLLGEVEPGKLKVYVGKSRQIKGRLQRHIQTKRWWDNVIYFLDNSRAGFSADDIEYLEWLLICKLRQANRIVLDNQNNPRANEPTVNYWEQSRFEKIYNEIAALAKMLKFDIFDRIYDNDDDAQIFFCKNNKGANATAYFRDNNIFVQNNSECRQILTNSGENSSYIVSTRRELLNSGALRQENNKLFFTQEYKFETPSAASSIILGTPSNGWKDWKDASGKSLDDLFRNDN